MKIAFNPSTVAALTTPPNNKDITFDLRGRNIFARGVKFYGTDTNTWRDIKINNVSIGSHTLDLRNGSNTTLTNTNGVVTINSTWRPVVDNLTSDSTTSSLSAKQGKVLKALIDDKSNSDHNHDGRYLKLTGGTMLGALNFANNTWNLVGDDSYIGDCNISGHFGIKAANTTYPGITFFNNASTFLGNLTAYSSNIKYGAYSLQFLDNGNTSVSASTWSNPFSDYNSNAVADGQAICVWGQASQLSNLSTDTGDMTLWLRRVNAKAATLNMVLDGEYYAQGSQRLAHVSEIPNKDSWNYDDRYYTKAESNAKYITDITTSVNKLTFTRNGSNIIRDITVNVVHSQGYLTNIPNKDATTKASPGLLIYNSYDYIGTSSYSSVLSINTGGTIQIAGNWGDDYARNLYWRSQSDRNVADYPWKSWRTILDSENYSSTLDSRYYTESEVNSLLDAKLNRQNLSYGTWNPRGYHLAADYHYNGGDLSISENNGKMYISVDGCFWQNEGQYRVLDTSDIGDIRDSVTLHQYLSATDAAWYPLVWGGASHNNTSDSTGPIYKSYDKLCWQTSSQTLYATNIQTNNIKNLSIGGGIYWNPNVESATDGSDAASITLVRSGVAGGTTLVLSQMNDTNDTIQFKTNTAARLYHNSYPILTTQNTYVNNNKGYINGTEITQVNNSDTLDNWHKDNIQWTGYITSSNSLSSYWFKMYQITVTGYQYNDITITFLVSEGYSKHFSIFHLEIRQNGTNHSGNYNLGVELRELVGNLRDKVVAYYNNSTGDVQLWGNPNGQYNTMNYTVLKKTTRIATDSSSLGILTAQSFSSVQTPPSTGYTRVTMARVGSVSYSDSTGSVHWNNVTNKPSTFNPAAHTHTVFKNNLMIKGTNGISDSASIHLGIGDSDTGFKWISDGVCQIYANNAAVGQWTSGGMDWFKNPTVNGNKVWNAGNDGSGSGLDADTLDGYHAASFVKMKQFRFNQYKKGFWTKILTITINSTSDLQPVIAFNWIPSECAREVWAEFTINWRSNSPIFYAIWKGTAVRTLTCVNSSGNIWNVWVQGDKNSYDPFGEVQVTYAHNISSYNGGSLGYSDSDPGGTRCTLGGYVNYARSTGNADTVDGEHASNFSYTHQSSFDFSKRKSGRIVTFDQSGTDYGWINGFASTHNNYLTSVIFNKHRSSNWYVGYMEGDMSTGETNGLQAVHKLAFADGDESYPIFLGYLNLFNGNDGTISSSFPCLGYSVPFTYTRGGAYCLINIPDTSFQTFYIKAAIASVHYSGAGMGHWVGNHRGDGAWWLHCDAVGSNAVQVKGFHLANKNNDSWWGGNPLYSGDGAAKIITVCLFGYVKFR